MLTPYREMAAGRRFVANRVISLSPDIHMQVWKLYLFPESRDRRHWLQKLRGYLLQTHLKIRPKGIYPDAAFYQTCLTSVLYIKGHIRDLAYYENVQAQIENKYEEEVFSDHAPEYPSEDTFFSVMEKFAAKVSVLLEQVDEVSFSSIVTIIDELKT